MRRRRTDERQWCVLFAHRAAPEAAELAGPFTYDIALWVVERLTNENHNASVYYLSAEATQTLESRI